MGRDILYRNRTLKQALVRDSVHRKNKSKKNEQTEAAEKKKIEAAGKIIIISRNEDCHPWAVQTELTTLNKKMCKIGAWE